MQYKCLLLMPHSTSDTPNQMLVTSFQFQFRQKECNRCTAAALVSRGRGGGRMCIPFLQRCTPHFGAIPENAASCNAPQPLDCNIFPARVQCVHKIGHARQKTPQYVPRTNSEANCKSVTRVLIRSGAQI